nr:protein aspartic protease in guard cell 2 [Quercus suber]
MKHDAKRVANLIHQLDEDGVYYPKVEHFKEDVGLDLGSGEYFIPVGLGTPPTPQYLVIDTGSDIGLVETQTNPANERKSWKLEVVHRDRIHPSNFQQRIKRNAKRVANLIHQLDEDGVYYPEVECFKEDVGSDSGSGEYFIPIELDTPPTPQYLVIDTGSDIDAPKDNNDNEADDRVFRNPMAGPSRKPLPESVRKEILELGFPDDSYNYLKHLQEIKNTGGGSAYYQNPKAKLEELPRDVKAYDASRVRISEEDADSIGKSIFSVASKTVSANLVEEEEEEEVDNRLNIVEEIEEKPENEVDKAGALGQQEVVDSLVFQNGVENQLVQEGEEIVGDKPRAPRL